MVDFSRFDLIENRLDRLEAIVDSNAKLIAANSDQTAQTERVLSEAIGRTLAVVERIEERAEEDRINFQEYGRAGPGAGPGAVRRRSPGPDAVVRPRPGWVRRPRAARRAPGRSGTSRSPSDSAAPAQISLWRRASDKG